MNRTASKASCEEDTAHDLTTNVCQTEIAACVNTTSFLTERSKVFFSFAAIWKLVKDQGCQMAPM
jgi:hypothetical protein